jgi:Leucine-rich repeat (LRR) protein
MKKLLSAMFVALLMVGCGEDVEVPKLIKCDGCSNEVSSTGEVCSKCSHPIADSVSSYKILARIRELKESGGRELSIIENQITDLTHLSGVVELTFLNLGSNRISDLSPLAGLVKLEELMLGNNKIKDLASLTGLKKLEFLHLVSNQTTDLTPLKELTKLKSLDLRGNSILEDQKAMLKKALPDCRIIFD